MSELEAELRRLAVQWADAKRIVGKREWSDGFNEGARSAFNDSANLARDHEAKRGDGWRTIESAPREPLVDRLLGGRLYGEWRTYVAGWDPEDECWADADRQEPPFEVTHWWDRPLPEPPVAEGEG